MNDIIKLEVGDILLFDGDAIVNSANKSLLRGSGFSGAIHKAAGAQKLHLACLELGGCETCDAKTTKAFDLACKWIIHAVGPNWYRHTPSESIVLLQQTYRAIFREAALHKMTRIAIPAISAGIYGFPADLAAEISTQEITAGVAENQDLKEVRLVFSETGKYNLTRQAFDSFCK
jgi:O-acetyl-ADP-ribose deacetylase (regulator of RNase III)